MKRVQLSKHEHKYVDAPKKPCKGCGKGVDLRKHIYEQALKIAKDNGLSRVVHYSGRDVDCDILVCHEADAHLLRIEQMEWKHAILSMKEFHPRSRMAVARVSIVGCNLVVHLTREPSLVLSL